MLNRTLDWNSGIIKTEAQNRTIKYRNVSHADERQASTHCSNSIRANTPIWPWLKVGKLPYSARLQVSNVAVIAEQAKISGNGKIMQVLQHRLSSSFFFLQKMLYSRLEWGSLSTWRNPSQTQGENCVLTWNWNQDRLAVRQQCSRAEPLHRPSPIDSEQICTKRVNNSRGFCLKTGLVKQGGSRQAHFLFLQSNHLGYGKRWSV